MPKKNTTTKSTRGAAKRRSPSKAAKPVEPDRFTEDGRKIVRLEKTRAHQKYPLKDGTDVPGASTIAKIGEDSSGLIHWAWKLGMDGQDYRKVRDKAADIGTIAHFLIECFLHNHVADLSEFSSADIEKATIAFNNFKRWWDDEGLTVIEPEVQLVSETYLFGGTIDAPSRDRDGKIVLLDWKTSKAIVGAHKVQLAGYEQLWNENRPDMKVQRRGIVRIGKESPDDFEVAWMFSAEPFWRVFQARLALHYAQLMLKKAA
jgi:hypothetical protein